MSNVNWTKLILDALFNARTEDDLEKAADIADEAVMVGALTQEEVDSLFDDFEPIIESEEE